VLCCAVLCCAVLLQGTIKFDADPISKRKQNLMKASFLAALSQKPADDPNDTPIQAYRSLLAEWRKFVAEHDKA
jgi:hypothetical protein